jgi:hypothetical protein
MTQYLTTIQLPDDFDPSAQDKEMESDIEALSKEMEASGVRERVREVFSGGLSPAREAKSLRAQPDGKVLVCRASGEVRPFFRSNIPSE